MSKDTPIFTITEGAGFSVADVRIRRPPAQPRTPHTWPSFEVVAEVRGGDSLLEQLVQSGVYAGHPHGEVATMELWADGLFIGFMDPSSLEGQALSGGTTYTYTVEGWIGRCAPGPELRRDRRGCRVLTAVGDRLGALLWSLPETRCSSGQALASSNDCKWKRQ